MTRSFHTQRLVQWHDTDAAGLAHFTAFFRYMEEIEHEFLRSRGLSVLSHDAQGELSWPRVSVRCDYVGAVRFEDVVDVELSISRLGTKSVSYEFQFSHQGRPVAVGSITAVCCRLVPGAPPQAIAIPAAMVERLGA